MNVSELSDVELNRAMIWCYGDRHPSFDLVNVEDFRGEIFMEIGEGHEYSPNYLTDYNLTMPLAVENNLQPSFSNSGMTSVPYYHSDFTGTGGQNIKHGTTYSNKNPLRAISEVLIMIAMEKKR